MVEGRLVVEVKAVEQLLPVHLAQVITYLKLLRLPVGLLVNFHVPVLREGLRRLVNPTRDSSGPPFLPVFPSDPTCAGRGEATAPISGKHPCSPCAQSISACPLSSPNPTSALHRRATGDDGALDGGHESGVNGRAGTFEEARGAARYGVHGRDDESWPPPLYDAQGTFPGNHFPTGPIGQGHNRGGRAPAPRAPVPSLHRRRPAPSLNASQANAGCRVGVVVLSTLLSIPSQAFCRYVDRLGAVLRCQRLNKGRSVLMNRGAYRGRL